MTTYAPFFDDAGHRMPRTDESYRIPDDALKALLDVRFLIAYDETMDTMCISHPYLHRVLAPDMAAEWAFYVDGDYLYIESDASMAGAVIYLNHPNLQGVALDAMFELYQGDA